MRIRSIKPSVFKDADLWDLGQSTGLPVLQAFEGLWCAADREGRFRWKPRELKTDILPYWDGDFSRVLDALMSRGFVVKYACDGREYGLVRTFKTHQVINNKEMKSSLPAPPENLTEPITSTRELRVVDASSTPLIPTQGEGNMEGNMEQEHDHISVGVTADMWHVFNRWREVWRKGVNTEFTKKRKRVVRERLKRYPLIDLIDAVEGAHMSPHHLGQNESGQVYDDLELHLRDDEKLETHRERKRRGGNGKPVNTNGITPAARAAAPEDYEADNKAGWPS